jgi:hypothetical protein
MSAVHASASARAGLAQLRNLEDADIPAIVRYWLESGDAHLDFLGIDRKLLGSEEEIRQRFRRALPSGRPGQPNLAFGITLDGAFVGYSLLNRHDLETNYSHWHITDPGCRALGLSTALYPWRIKAYFDSAPIERLIHQTRTRNLAVNRMLDKFVPIAATRYIDQPDGVARPGEFHIRYVRRGDIPHLFETAARLRDASK